MGFGDIEGKTVADLGCGCGVLSLGCVMLGADFVTGFDIDEDALAVFSQNIEDFDMDNLDLIALDICNLGPDWENRVDTVVMNPPFGTKHNKGRYEVSTGWFIHGFHCCLLSPQNLNPRA